MVKFMRNLLKSLRSSSSVMMMGRKPGTNCNPHSFGDRKGFKHATASKPVGEILARMLLC